MAKFRISIVGGASSMASRRIRKQISRGEFEGTPRRFRLREGNRYFLIAALKKPGDADYRLSQGFKEVLVGTKGKLHRGRQMRESVA